MIYLCDRITVLRDGRLITTIGTKDVTPATLANLMVGRELEDFYPAKLIAPTGPAALEVEHLTVPNWVEDLSFSVRPGELVGIAGLIGAGRTEAAEAVAGLRARSGGTIKRNGNPVRISNPADAMKHGIGYVSEDRKSCGLILSMSTSSNTTLANLSAYAHPVIDHAAEKASVRGWVDKLQIRVGSVDAAVGDLSGGNQQKVSVAKWLDTKPQVLILDEPTRGVDVGAKREIYNLIVELAREGLACVVISSEMPELIGLCHRILVLREGRLMGELDQSTMTEENIMMLAAGVEKAA
jgi:ribose transport system ATP-binding protein